jgi:hypothetical protein
MKLIDADKLIEWVDRRYYSFDTKFSLYETIRQHIEAGTFSPTPPVQPDITQRAGKYFIVSVKDEGFHLQSDEGEEVHYILIDINGRMEGYSDDLKEIESIYGRVTRIPGEVITDDQR